MTLEEMKTLQEKDQKKLFYKLKAIRTKAKIVNFSALYGVSKDSLSRNSGMEIKEAKKLLDVYWERNWAVKKFAESCTTKSIGSKTWVLNPISGFWCELRAIKDIFSTVNQSSSVFVFDLWVSYMRKLGLKISLQMHDEIVANIQIGQEQLATNIVNEAIRLVNQQLKLNIEIGCSIHFGFKYSDIH